MSVTFDADIVHKRAYKFPTKNVLHLKSQK